MKYLKYGVCVSLTSRKNANEFYLRFRITYGGERLDLYTGIALTNKQWDEKNRRVKQGVTVNGIPFNVLNEDLRAKKNLIENYFIDCSIKNTTPSLPQLKNLFRDNFKQVGNESSNMYDVFDQYISAMAETRMWEKSMVEKHARMKKRLEEFNPQLKFQDLNEGVLNQILRYFSKSMYNDALEKTLFCLKTFLRWAKSKKYTVNDEVFAFRPKLLKVQKAVRFLTIPELTKIRDLDLSDKVALEMTRDLFIFQCCTALRYSDLKLLKKNNIIRQEGEKHLYALRIVTEKDNGLIYLPLISIAEGIYLKYINNEYPNDALFPVISNQKYNEHLKELGEIAKIEGEWIDYEYRLNEKIEIRTPKKELSSHTARRTFVVTAANAGIPFDLIALVTSHADMKTMKPYLTATSRGAQQAVDAVDAAINNAKAGV